MLISIVPVVVCLVGLLMFALPEPTPPRNPKIAAIGKDMFFCGLLVSLYVLSGHVVSLGR